MKKNGLILLINISTLILSISALIYAIQCRNLIQSMNTNVINNNVNKEDLYVEADKDDSFYIPDLSKDESIFKLSENNQSLILSNPEKNSHLLKYEIYFKDYNFSTYTNLIPAGESGEVMLYDKLEKGTYNIIVKMSFWYNEDTFI